MNTSALKPEFSSNESQIHEGPVAKAIEKQTAKLPSDTFLWLSVGTIGASLALQLTGRKQLSLFVGQWAPTFLIMGLYNKLVKITGIEGEEEEIDEITSEEMENQAA